MDYERIAQMLERTFAWSLSRTFTREEAEELTQEILFQATRSLGELREESKFEPWFWRLAGIVLKVFRRGRAKARGIMSFDEVAALAFEEEYDVEADDEYKNLRRGIAQMSAAYRDIVVLHYYDNMTCKEISKKLGLPQGTVTYRLSLARDKLKERYSQMNETALKPMQLKISIAGDGNYNGDDRPFPWQYINDALSQNILWHAYREPKTVEQLAELTGVPAFFIEDRIENLIKREAVIQPTKSTVQTDFLIFDESMNSYAVEHSDEVVSAVSERFFELSNQLTERILTSGFEAAGRSHDEILCLLSVMLLDKFVPDYKPAEYKMIRRRYDGHRWDYVGFIKNILIKTTVSIGMEKSMNNFESGKLAHYSYHFAPFEYRKMMFDHEIDVCHSVLRGSELTEKQKEYAAGLIASGQLAKNESGGIVCTVPVFTKEQYEFFVDSAKDIFADFLPFYSDRIKKYLDGYMRLFPKHLKDAANRNGFLVFVAMFKAIASDWAERGKISIPNGAICDALIMM